MELLKRITEPTPSFWQKVRNISIALGSVAGAVLVAPVALPVAITTIAGYVATAGTVATILAQSTSTMR